MKKVMIHGEIPPYRIGQTLMELVGWARHHADWRVLYSKGALRDERSKIRRFPVDGALVSGAHPEVALMFQEESIPVVMIDPAPFDGPDSKRFAGVPSCHVDSKAAGRFAAEFLLSRRYSSFGAAGAPSTGREGDLRIEGFRERLAEAGHDCRVFVSKALSRDNTWATDMPDMELWLKSLPRGSAVFAAIDESARFVLEACGEASLSVPGDIAVLGCDDDPAMCETTSPRLSSVHFDVPPVVAAAKMLKRIMEGDAPENPHLLVSSFSVTMRDSLRAMSTANPFLERGLDFIHENAVRQDASVPGVVAAMNCSRRYAEKVFKDETGKTIRESIEEARFHRVKELLRSTSLPVSAIAERCGFASESRLSLRFSQVFGMSPTRWRRQ